MSREPDWATADGTARIYVGDCLGSLRQMEAESIQCCVTSPPYWGLRDYGHDGQLGLEKTPEEYVAKMVDVFREARRVLRDDGTLWLNLGDSYATGGSSEPSDKSTMQGTRPLNGAVVTRKRPRDIKPKDLVGIPWRVAFALQADGWYLRQDIIWHKPNPMPESVTDRCTKSHEYIFLLAKSARYYYDAEAVKEKLADCNAQRTTAKYDTSDRYGLDNGGNCGLDSLAAKMRSGEVTHRNRRSVWTVSTKPYSGAHFATFPPDLIEPCILAGCPEGGVVLDPFNGSGTTGAVCIKHGRRYVGLELNPAYVELAKVRIGEAVREHATPLFDSKPAYITRPMFDSP